MDTLARLQDLQRSRCRAMHAQSSLRTSLDETDASLRACEISCSALAGSASAVELFEAVRAGEVEPSDAVHLLDECAMREYMQQAPSAVRPSVSCTEGIQHKFSTEAHMVVCERAEEPVFQPDAVWSVSWEYAIDVLPCTLTLSCILPAFAGEGRMSGRYVLLGCTGTHRVLLCKGTCATGSSHKQAVPYLGQGFRSFELHCEEWKHDGWMQPVCFDVV